MASKRDNRYWVQRLQKEGHTSLLQRVEGGEITVYRATQLAGFRQKKPPSPAGKLSYHWKRASHDERQRFVAAHAKDINRVLREIRDLLLEAKKPAE